MLYGVLCVFFFNNLTYILYFISVVTSVFLLKTLMAAFGGQVSSEMVKVTCCCFVFWVDFTFLYFLSPRIYMYILTGLGQQGFIHKVSIIYEHNPEFLYNSNSFFFYFIPDKTYKTQSVVSNLRYFLC